MREFGKKFAAWVLAVVMVVSLLPAGTQFASAADNSMAAVTFANESYPYGKNMSASSATLVTEIKEGTANTVQWYYSTEENGTYQEVAGATSLTYTFSPKVGDKYWYKCRVNGTDTKAVQLVKASRYGSADIKPLRCYDMWYVTNGKVAYTVWPGNTQFDVIGIYEKDGKTNWINTSFNSCWGTNNVRLSAFRFAFDTANDHKINMEAKLADDVTSFGVGADVMLADYSITNYSDYVNSQISNIV